MVHPRPDAEQLWLGVERFQSLLQALEREASSPAPPLHEGGASCVTRLCLDVGKLSQLCSFQLS